MMHLTEPSIESERQDSLGVHHHPAASPSRALRLLWLHDTARRTGGCEQYMARTVDLLRKRGIQSTLLYGESGEGPLDLLPEFDHAFPIVDLPKQLAVIQPDVIYSHRLSGCSTLDTLIQSGIPTLRFFHDHKLFCPREHKYTVLNQATCTRTIGAGCYACMGVVNRSDRWPGIRFQSVGKLRKEQAAHQSLSGFVVGSQYMADHLADHGFRRDKIHVLPLFTDPPADSISVVRDPSHLLFVGQIVRGKGLDTLLKALALTAPHIRLTVVGEGAQEAESKRWVEKLDLGSRVTFAGKMPSHEIADLYRGAGCLVVPSRSPETFGQVGVEAMSYGLPIIAAKVGGISEWLEHNHNGIFCEPNDVNSFALAIDRMVADPELAARFSQNARDRYRSKFQPEQHVSALESLLRGTVESTGVKS